MANAAIGETRPLEVEHTRYLRLVLHCVTATAVPILSLFVCPLPLFCSIRRYSAMLWPGSDLYS